MYASRFFRDKTSIQEGLKTYKREKIFVIPCNFYWREICPRSGMIDGKSHNSWSAGSGVILLLMVPGPADAVAPKDLCAAVAEGCGAVPAVIPVLPTLGAPRGIPVTAGP